MISIKRIEIKLMMISYDKYCTFYFPAFIYNYRL